MAGSIYAHVRADEAVITDSDRGFIKNREIEVREETSAHADIASVITVEWLVDEGILVTLSKETPDQPVPFLQHRRAQFVVLPDSALGGIEPFLKIRMRSIVIVEVAFQKICGNHNFGDTCKLPWHNVT